MAYDEVLADRLRDVLAAEPDVTQKRMFGGLAFLVGGRLAVAASGSGGLLLRCEPGSTAALLDPPAVDRFVMRGRAMDGWLRVEAAAVEDDDALGRWVDVGVGYARSLPPP